MLLGECRIGPAEDGRVHVVEPRAGEALKVSESRKHCGGSEA